MKMINAQRQTQGWRAGRWLALFALTCYLGGCASSQYTPMAPEAVGFLERAVTLEDGPLTLRAALPDADETAALTGLDLYDQGVQPVWIEVTNGSDQGVRAALWSIDRDYFSPLEVAYTNKGEYSGEVILVEPLGVETVVHIQSGDKTLQSLVPGASALKTEPAASTSVHRRRSQTCPISTRPDFSAGGGRSGSPCAQ